MTTTDKKTSPQGWFISTFYFFKNPGDLDQISAELESAAEACGVKGLFILGAEGINSTFAATSPEGRQNFQKFVRERFELPELLFKNSESATSPFPKFKIKRRDEIVTLGTPELKPQGPHKHLSPEEWEQILRSDEDYVLIDTRNRYEVGIGTFQGAIDPGIDQFTDFPDFVESQNIPKDKKMLIFCTGGIRCEKGLLELERRGFENVYQLEGGILNYLEKFPRSKFEGECFVFDQRVALDQDLKPSQIYKMCPHCGQPGQVEILCGRCDSPAVICESCEKMELVGRMCSKNCAHHTRLGRSLRGKPQVPHWKQSPSQKPSTRNFQEPVEMSSLSGDRKSFD